MKICQLQSNLRISLEQLSENRVKEQLKIGLDENYKIEIVNSQIKRRGKIC